MKKKQKTQKNTGHLDACMHNGVVEMHEVTRG